MTDRKIPIELMAAADPAQSAPSAEPLDPEKFLYERLGFTFKAINSSLTVTIFRPEFKIFSFSQYDGKWDVVYLMDKAWELLVELAAEKEAAALRTAQLERERDALREGLQDAYHCAVANRANVKLLGTTNSEIGKAELIRTAETRIEKWRALLTVAAQTPPQK